MTASDDIWSDPGIVIPREGDYPSYVSHAAGSPFRRGPGKVLKSHRHWLRRARRRTVFSTLKTPPTNCRSSTGLPSRISCRGAIGDIYTGVELKRLERTTFFNGVAVADGAADLFQMVLGWSNSFDDRLGRTAVDVRVKANPGGVLQGNAATTWQTFTNGRVQSVDYAYLAADISRTTSLPNRFFWVSASRARSPGRCCRIRSGSRLVGDMRCVAITMMMPAWTAVSSGGTNCVCRPSRRLPETCLKAGRNH